MAKYSREFIINNGIQHGAKASDINYTLKKYGYKPDYNPILEKENWKNIGSNLLSNARSLARDARTFGGYVLSPLSDTEQAFHNAPKGKKLEAAKKAFIESVNDNDYRKTITGALAGGAIGTFVPKVGPIAGALTGAGIGMAGSPKEFANAVLSPYNTSVEDIQKGKVDWKDIAQGVFNNPLYAALDAAPIYGPKVTKGISRSLENAPTAVKQIFPDEQMRAFNRQITNSISSAKAKRQGNYLGYLNLETMPHVNRERLVKNMITNDITDMTSEEKLLANKIKDNLRNIETEFISRGYADPTEFRDNTRTQYVMYKLGDKNNLLHDDVYRIIRGEELRTGNTLPSETELKRIQKLADEGGKLYDEGKISWLSQKLVPYNDSNLTGLATELNKGANSYFNTQRILGKQSTAKLANVFDRTIKEQIDQFANFIDVEDTISNLVKNYEMQPIGKIKNGYELPKGKSAFSVKAFKDYIKKHGTDSDIGEALRRSRVLEEGAYILDDMYLDMINNAFKKTPTTGNRRVLNAFKKAVLANPHWVMLNRIGNWSNNFMDGVTLGDYHDAKIASRAGLIPEEMKLQTSFGSYVGSLEGTENIQGIDNTTRGLGKSMMQPVSRIKQAYGRFKDSKKRFEDIGELTKQILANTSDVSANPWYKLEASLEYSDRSANLVRQAKRYGDKVGKDWKDVLKEAKSNSKLYSELNTGVNKALGDYVGKNYALPQGIYNSLSELVPFYRFLTQTGRTTAHQLANNPLGFAMNVTIPSRVGFDLSDYYASKYNLDPDEYAGGMPYLQENNNIRTIGFEPLPAANVLESFGNIGRGKDLTSLLGPYLSTIPDVLAFRRFGKTASTPRRTEMMLNGDYTAANKNFQPTLGETTAYGLNTLLNTLYHPYRVTTQQVLPVLTMLQGKGRQSGYDTNSLIENPLTYKKTLPSELIGSWFGIQSRSNYQNKGKSKFTKGLDRSMSNKLKKQIKSNEAKK